MVKVVWTKRAFQNLSNIGDYIEQESSRSYSIKTIDHLYNSVYILERFPYAGRMVPEIERTNIRELIRLNYRIIYYVVDECRVDILTVQHSSRDRINIYIYNNNELSP